MKTNTKERDVFGPQEKQRSNNYVSERILQVFYLRNLI